MNKKKHSIDIEPYWCNLQQFFSEGNAKDSLQAILNLYQGYSDFVKCKGGKYASAFFESLKDAGFKISDKDGNDIIEVSE